MHPIVTAEVWISEIISAGCWEVLAERGRAARGVRERDVTSRRG
jgi:hypothetical protein